MTKSSHLIALATAATLALASAGHRSIAADAPPPAVEPVVIDVTKNPTVQKLLLKRLVNASLAAVVRKPEKPYTTIYTTILTRKGMDRKYRTEAAEALAKINDTDPAVELINGIGGVAEDDKATVKDLVGLLMAQKPAALAKQKEKLTGLANEAENPTVRQAAYAALAVADGKGDAVWEAAAGKDDGRTLLMGGIGLIPDGKVRATFADKVLPLTAKAKDEAEQVAAIDAASYLPGREADAVKALGEQVGDKAGATRDAAVRSLGRVPPNKIPKDQAAPLAAKLIAAIKATGVDDRVKPAGVDAAQAVTNLSGVLPPADGAAVRKGLRELVPTLVKIRTYREQMLYDTAYFVVPAGKPVQISLENDDAMPHNVVVLAPGAYQKVNNLVMSSSMPAPADDEPLPYVPKIPEVLHATKLATEGETLTLSFKAPDKPGEYPYVCTHPGHSERMYGVMLVVPDIDAYEKSPTPPTDPKDKKPFKSDKVEPMDAPAPGGHAH